MRQSDACKYLRTGEYCTMLKGILTSVSQVMVSVLLVLLSQQDNLKGTVTGEFVVNVFSPLYIANLDGRNHSTSSE